MTNPAPPSATIQFSLTPEVDLELVRVEGGTFTIGSEDEEAHGDEKHRVDIQVKDFWCGKYPITQEQWYAIMDGPDSYFQGNKRPMEQVSWLDAQAFLKKLREQTGKPFRLLTEAEWEYAARGGQKSKGYKYAGSNDLDEVGWYTENSHHETKPVGLKKPNELGLFDLSGNVYEWVEDQWHDNYEGIPQDGSAWVDREEGAGRVCRGGRWAIDARYCRVSSRFHWHPGFRFLNVGFRVALSLQSVG